MTKSLFVEIRGVQFVNKGAELMLLACMDAVLAQYPDAQIVLAPNRNSPYRSRALLGTLQKVVFRVRGFDFNALSYFIPKSLRAILLERFGLVFEPEIDVVIDASGFAYGDQWGGRNVKVMANELLRLRKHRKTYVFMPQAFGPFAQTYERKLLSKALPMAALVSARDSRSFEYLKLLCPEPPLVQYGDFTNLVLPVRPNKLPSTRYGLIIPNSAMVNPKKNYNGQWIENYLRVLQLHVEAFQTLGIQPVVLNHEGLADLDICQQISVMNKGLLLINEPDARVVKGWIAEATVVVSSRFHGCVSALSSGVPCLASSWSHKYEMLFHEYGAEFAMLDPAMQAADVMEKLQLVLATEHVAALQQAAAQFRQQSQRLWQQVFLKINGL